MQAFSPRHLLLLSGASAAAMCALATPAAAQNADEVVIVTATRRAVDIQNVPINIAAVGQDQIDQLGAADLSDLAQYVPGLHVVNQGGRSSNPIIVRGLNANGSSSNDGANDGGGTVATYVGETPIFIDMRLEDLERVEVLLGPQGTLYGAGTLGGAVRYILNKPDFSGPGIEVRGDAYDYSQGEDISTSFGLTMNAPLTDTFALRASVDFLNDTGFIDCRSLAFPTQIRISPTRPRWRPISIPSPTPIPRKCSLAGSPPVGIRSRRSMRR